MGMVLTEKEASGVHTCWRIRRLVEYIPAGE
jgi:hypothetical protein